MKTVGDIKEKIKGFTCLEEGSFISDDELCCLINMAQQELAKKIGCLNKDFYTTCHEETVAPGTEFVTLPDDVQGHKVKAVFWTEGKTCCKLKKTDWDCPCSNKQAKPCEYRLFNKKDVGPAIYFEPVPNKEGSVRIIYDRQPVEITSTTSPTEELEFPEWCMFYFAFVRMFIYEKEKNPMLNLAISQMNEQERLIEDCLTGSSDGCEIEVDEDWACYVNEW